MVLPPSVGRSMKSATETDGLLHQPLRDMERRARRRRCLGLILASVFFSLLGALAIWHATWDGVTASSDEAVLSGLAAEALRQLNRPPSGKHHHVHGFPTGSCELTVLILRHCEKMGPGVTDRDGNEHCSYLGLQRAEYLATLFAPARSSSPKWSPTPLWPGPTQLMAYSPYRSGASHWNFREYETLRPLNAKYNIGIDLVKQHDARRRILDMIRHTGDGTNHCGRTVVVAWKHDYIPALAAGLGCGPDQGCPVAYPADSFDQVWQLKYVHDPEALMGRSQAASPDGGQQRQRRHLRPAIRPLDPATDAIPYVFADEDHGWSVYGAVVQQHFDPLAFAMGQGKYGHNAMSEGGTTMSSPTKADENDEM